ncbi:hypothetical protein EST38_g5546 [Candolleomyces aberdarensis]|uniref:DUF4246 domain-containing protein n=1 Tax=Candolleomyces aberdarensis TaxID=2316362 RepID=A0A4Q2DKA8_9AGAR|nr:hypothetical protein EST38_g5546 [Candolleomyces aberdarensis]
MIEDVISAAIPLWDATLAPLADFNYIPKRRINRRREKFWQDRSKQTPAKHAAMQSEFTLPNKPSSFSLIERYGRKGIPLQIIVRMESIELTPKKSKYSGGKWHLEGQMNEHIVATAVYDYSTENIMPSNISFRQRWKDDVLEDELVQTMADDAEFPFGWYKTYRVNKYQPQIQWVGSVEMKQGRLISYPNILQNKVEPVTLQNIQQPGYRKMLILYLVDPNVRIISTAEVPWQRFSTWREEVTERVLKPGLRQQARVGLHRLPVELLELVFQEIEPSPMTMKEAKDVRTELIKERTQLVSEHTKVFGSMSESSSPF